ncbi:MAG TPA: peptidylprolyl isomerase [Candidatus Thermoplasmatota archaeon]|jgi:peptidyl-prolyl cis-trans isomerase A (cyclophilin A)|nr:peptidylprolyl isomerase [Candidatus Thermoplasmatota archaeon]
MRAWLLALLLLGTALAGCNGPPAPPPPPPGPPPPTQAPAPGFNPVVKFSTDLGDFYVEVFEEQVPAMAANFLGYARSHFYDGQRVHRVLHGFLMQLGDPATRDATKPRSTWGQPDPNLPTIRDEFHPALDFAQAGMVALATAGPDTGSSQFFITTAPNLSQLQDTQPIFGRVAAGLAVVQAIGEVPTAAFGQVEDVPVEDVVVRSTEVLEARRTPSDVRHGLTAYGYHDRYNTTQGHILQFVAVVHNVGTVRENVTAGVTAPDNWTYQIPCPRVRTASDCPFDPVVGAGATMAVFFQLRTPPGAAEGDVPVALWFAAGDANTTLPVVVHVGTLGATPQRGQNVSVHYVGAFPDGRLFDTSLLRLVHNATVLKSAFFVTDKPNAYPPLEFPLGSPSLVEGFTLGTEVLRVGEIGAVLLPPEKAYGLPGPQAHRLAGRWLVFTIELLTIADASG